MVHSIRTRADQRSFELNETEFSRFVKSKRNYNIRREVVEEAAEQVVEQKLFSATEVAREALQESVDAVKIALESAHVPEKLESIVETLKDSHIRELVKDFITSVQDAHVKDQLIDATEHIKKMSKVLLDNVLQLASEPRTDLKELASVLPHTEFTVEERDLPKHELSKAEKILGEDLSSSTLYTGQGIERKIPIQELETAKVTTLEIEFGPKVTKEDVKQDVDRLKQVAVGLLESGRHLMSDTVEIVSSIFMDRKADYEESKEMLSDVFETLKKDDETGIQKIDRALDIIDKSLSGKNESEEHMDDEKFDEIKKVLEKKLSLMNKNKTIDDSDHMGLERFEDTKEYLEQNLSIGRMEQREL